MKENNGLKNFLVSGAGKVGMIVVLYALIFGIMMLIVNVFENNEYVALLLAVALGYFGWKALNRIQPDIFLILPIGGWIVFFIIKGVLSVMIGIFVAPFVISKKVAELIQENM